MKNKNWIGLGGLLVIVLGALFTLQNKNSRDTIVLGAIMPLSGDLATYGKPVREGMEFAISEINENGGVEGKEIKIVFEDDSGEPRKAVDAFNKLVDIDKVPMILGPLTSSASMATAPVAESRRVVQLSTIAGTMKLSDAGDYVFRLFPSDEFQGAYIAEVARDIFQSKRAAIIYVNNAYGQGIKEVVKNKYVSLGGEIIIEESVSEGGTDFNSQIAKIKKAMPDLIFGLLYYNEGAQFLIQSKQQGLNVRILGGDAWFGPIGELAGSSADLLVFSSVAFGPDHTHMKRMQDFIRAFRGRYNRDPDSYVATGYDAVYAAKKAIEAGGFINPNNLKDAMYNVSFDGALGKIKFNKRGDNIGSGFSLFVINKDKVNLYN